MNLQIDLGDPELFGNDAGEDEQPEVLSAYFVGQPAFNSFLDKSKEFRIARGRKGMGKSALLSKFAYDRAAEDDGALIVRCLRANIVGVLSPPSSTDFSVLENYWKQAICQYITLELGRISGWALSDDQMAAVEASELAGFRGRSLIGSLVARLKGKLGPIELTPSVSAAPQKLLSRLTSGSASTVYFLLDDVDSRFVDTEEERALVAAFFSAARSLVREVEGIRIRATVRTDVWSRLRTNEDLDKCEQYVVDIHWSNDQLDSLLAKRVHAYLLRHFAADMAMNPLYVGKDNDRIVDLVFDSRIRWGDSNVRAFVPVRILSGGRPRWMAQLCRLAGSEAMRRSSDRIGRADINSIMGKFGRLRMDDLYKEHLHQFADLRRLIECFSQAPRRFHTQELLNHIAKKYVSVVGTSNVPKIDGSVYSRTYQLASLLFKTGFIAGHNFETPTLAYPEFISFEMRPDLLTAETNLDDGLVWEVQPSYRTVLRIQ